MAYSPPSKFDVFLSFRGEDTRKNFVGHLHDALVRKRISTFKDDGHIERGDEISGELLSAIERSRVAVVVVSEDSASSGWCLNELTKIMECREKRSLRVIPIFYEVDPSDVRKQTGKVGVAMKKHEEREHPEKVQRWRETLIQLGNLPGSWLYERDNELLRARVIDDTITNIKRMIEPLEIQSETEVGKETISRLDLHEDEKRPKHLTGHQGNLRTFPFSFFSGTQNTGYKLPCGGLLAKMSSGSLTSYFQTAVE